MMPRIRRASAVLAPMITLALATLVVIDSGRRWLPG